MTILGGPLREPERERLPRRDPDLFSPVFVLCPPRSYSTAFIAMLGNHPGAYAFPELRLFYGDTVRAALDVRWHATGLVRALARLRFGEETEESLARAARWLESKRDVGSDEMLDYLLRLIHPRIGIDKTPDTTSFDGQLDRALRMYPRARIIHLVRHPTATIRSMIELWNGRGYVGSALVTNCATSWYSAHVRALEASGRVDVGHAIRVRAEEALRDSEVLGRVAKWLGLACDGRSLAAMRHPEAWEYAAAPSCLRWGGADQKFFDSPQLRATPNRTDEPLPESWEMGTALRAAIMRLAEYFEYSA